MTWTRTSWALGRGRSAGGPWREGRGDHRYRLKTPPSRPPHLPGPVFGSSPRPRVPRGLEPWNHLPDASGPSVLGLLRGQAQELRGSRSPEGLTLRRNSLVGAVRSLAASTHSPPPPAGTLMVCIVVGARKLGVNPDNIATPIAASLGDLITLSLLAVVSSFFYRHRGGPEA